jgi:triosephosphate isomerase
MIFLNFKTYKESAGTNAVFLAKIAASLSQESKIPVAVAPQAIDIKNVAKVQGILVWAQHIDLQEVGRSTGWFPAESAKTAGVAGTFLNHSEHKLDIETLRKTVQKCKEVGLETLVFVESPEEAKMVIGISPSWIAYEPPELIASPYTSVARAKPEIIESVIKIIPENIKFAVGAGIKDDEDVRVSRKLGVKAVVLSSAFVLADDPKMVLWNIARGFKEGLKNS